MNNKLKITLIVGAVLLVGGLAACVAGYAAGGMKDVVFTAAGRPQVVDWSDGKQLIQVDETFDDVSAIKINVDAMSKVVVKEGPTFSVKGQSLAALGEFKAGRAADGTLEVTQGSERKGWWFGFSFPGLFAGRDGLDSSYLEVTVPRGTSLSAVGLDVDAGAVRVENIAAGRIAINASYGDVEVENLTADAITADSSSGDIKAKGLTCGSFNTRSSYGATEVENVDAKVASVDSSAGRIEIDDLSAPESLTVDSSYGDVELAAVNVGTAKIDLASGNFSADGFSVSNSLKIDSSYGDIAIAGLLRGESVIDSAAGNVDLKLDGAEDDYFVAADTSTGSVTIGGGKTGASGSGHFESGPSSAPNSVRIDSSFGEVKVDFRR
jgi:DUF4097 and DUF4098 domain-containing protein YvlB